MLNNLVFANVAILITHQIDAAYWHEWEMFKLPGGIQLYNLINLVLFIAILSSTQSILNRTPTGFRNCLIVGGLSLLVLPIHACFAIAGFQQFHLPVSIAIIGLSFVAATSLIIVTMQSRAIFSKKSNQHRF
jgi:hypothetical protein